MQRKIALLSFITAATFFAACSDEPTNANPIDPNGGIQDSIPVINPEDPLNQQGDPNQGQGQQNQLSSATGPVNPQSSNAQPGISSATQPGISSSSAQIIAMSSSVGLKEYDDNHKAKATFLPKAGFYSNLTIEPPTPTKGGEIKCTFDGSFPTQGSQAITSAMQITKNTVVRCSEFVNGQPADTTTQTYFIGENVSMPVVALTVNHHDMFDSTDGFYATGPMNQLRCTNPNFNQMSMGGTCLSRCPPAL